MPQPLDSERILGRLEQGYRGRDSTSPDQMITHVELLRLCSLAESHYCQTDTKKNWRDNAGLEMDGPLSGSAQIGDTHLEVLISPVQGRLVFSGLNPGTKQKLHHTLSPENLPIGLKRIVQVSDTEDKTCVDLNLLPVGVPKLALTDGFGRELCRILGLGLVPDLQYTKIPEGDPRLNSVECRLGSLAPNLSFLVSRPGDTSEPVWTHAASIFRDESEKAQSIIAVIAEPSGRGKTLVGRDIIEKFIQSDACSKKGLGVKRDRLDSEMNHVLMNVYYAHERLDNLVIVSPKVENEATFKIENVMADFQRLCSMRPRGATILVIDNAQFLQFPTSGQWLNEFEEFLNTLADRQDGSGFLILAEHLPPGVNESQFQGHRLHRVELPFTSEDFGLPKGKTKEINTNAVGYQLITKALLNDPGAVIYYKVVDRLYPDKDNPPPESFGETYRTGVKALAGQMAQKLISHPEILQLFKVKEVANFLSFSHINDSAKGLWVSLVRALEDSTTESWLEVKKNGSVVVRNPDKLKAIIDAATIGLVREVKSLAEGKIAEAEVRKGDLSTQAIETPVLGKPIDVLVGIKSWKRELEKEKQQLTTRLETVEHKLVTTHGILEYFSAITPDNLNFIVSNRPLFELLLKLTDNQFPEDQAWNILLNRKEDLIQDLANLGALANVPEPVLTALGQLGGLLSVIDSGAEWGRVTSFARSVLDIIKSSNFSTNISAVLDSYDQAVKFLGAK